MTGGQSTIKSELVAYRFEGANIIRQTRLFNSSNCSGDVAINFEETGTIKIGSRKSATDQGRKIDFDYNALQAEVTTDAGAAAANGVHLCGITDWVPNKPRDVRNQSKDLNCYAAQVPRQVANIYRVDNGTLYFGTLTKESVLDSERPSILDMTNTFTAA